MRGTDWDLQKLRKVQSEGTGCLYDNPFQGGYLRDFSTHCLYYFPATGHGSK